MAASHLLAIDIGTQSVRAVVINQSEEFLFEKRLPLAIKHIESDRVEQDPTSILAATRLAIRSAITAIPNIDSAALAIQRSTVVAWDQQTGQAVSSALSWQDTRAAAQVFALKTNTESIKHRSGLMLSPHYGASKLCWLLNNEPNVAKAYSRYSLCIGPLVSFILFHLLKARPYLCDESNAARTQLWNIHLREWDTQLCAFFNVPIDLLPEVKPTHADYGVLDDHNIPLQVVCGDQSAAFFGAGKLPEKTAVINIGTGAFLLCNAGEKPAAIPALLDTLAISSENSSMFLVEGTVNGAGAALEWIRQQSQTTLNYKQLDQFLQQTDDLPVFINTVGGLGSPWWNSHLEPSFIPTRINCKQKPIPCLAAAVESIAFMLHTNLDTLRKHGIPIQQCLVSGGLSRLDSLCQKLANLDFIQVLRNRETESTVLGLAQLSGQLEKNNFNIRHRFSPKSEPGLQQRYKVFCSTLTKHNVIPQ